MTHTVAVHAEDQFCPLAGSHGIPVDAHYPCYGSAICLHIGGAVMGFAGNYVIIVIIKTGDTRVIP